MTLGVGGGATLGAGAGVTFGVGVGVTLGVGAGVARGVGVLDFLEISMFLCWKSSNVLKYFASEGFCPYPGQ